MNVVMHARLAGQYSKIFLCQDVGFSADACMYLQNVCFLPTVKLMAGELPGLFNTLIILNPLCTKTIICDHETSENTGLTILIYCLRED